MSKPLVLDGTGKTGEIPANEPLQFGNAALSASGLTAPRTYTFQDKSGAVLLANRVFTDEITEFRVPEDFTTVEEAMYYLSGCIFTQGTSARVTINNSTGFSIDGFNLPNVLISTSEFTILGAYIDLSVASITGGAGNYLVTFNISDTTNYSIGDTLYFPGDYLVGTGTFQALAGICKVTAKSASTITCLYKYYKSPPFPTLTLTRARILQQSVSHTARPNYAYISNCTFSNIELYANTWSIYGCDLSAVSIYSLDAAGTASVINSHINSLSLCSSGATAPCSITHSDIDNLIGAFSCNSAGLTISLDSTVILDTSAANSFCVMGNNAIGVLVEDSKVLWAGTGGCPISAKHNLPYDIRATGCGYVRATSILNSPSLNPAANTIGNGKSLIRTF